MINKDKIKGFAVGIISMTLISSTVYATSIEKNISAVYNGIKIYVDGTMIQPKDGTGKIVEPFISNGTTYLPVRAVSEALGKEVKWDANTRSVFIGKLPEMQETVINKTEDKLDNNLQEFVVNNEEEFIKAIGSNRKIILKSNLFNLSRVANIDSGNKGVSWYKESDGYELRINEVSNLIIEGEGNKPVEIVVEPRYAQILQISNCNGITFKNIKAGHTIIPDKYFCNAGVLGIQDSKDIKIEDCILYGCGSQGISAFGVSGLKMKNSIIEKCNLRVLSINTCDNFTFDNCKFRECKFEDMFNIYKAKNVIFSSCEISNNDSTGFDLFEIDNSSGIEIINSRIINNKANKIGFNIDVITGTSFEGNSFDKK